MTWVVGALVGIGLCLLVLGALFVTYLVIVAKGFEH